MAYNGLKINNDVLAKNGNVIVQEVAEKGYRVQMGTMSVGYAIYITGIAEKPKYLIAWNDSNMASTYRFFTDDNGDVRFMNNSYNKVCNVVATSNGFRIDLGLNISSTLKYIAIFE